jgi:flagellin-like protein
MNKKAITPIIALVLLLMLTIIAVASAYYFFAISQRRIQASIAAQIEAQLRKTIPSAKIAGLRALHSGFTYVYIQNLGSEEIPSLNLTVSVVDEEGVIIGTQLLSLPQIPPNEIREVVARPVSYLEEGKKVKVRVSLPYGVEISDVAKVGKDSSLVLYLPFDEVSGIVAYDLSGNGNNGTLYDANHTNSDGDTPPQWVDGKFGNALSFDGVDDFVLTLEEIEMGDSITIEAWINLFSIDGGGFRQVVEFRTNGNETYLETRFGDRKIHFTVHYPNPTSGEEIDSISENLTFYQWYHLVGTYDGENQDLYLDGSLVNSTLWTEGFYINSTLSIGKDHEEDWQFWHGVIDELRIYTRTLTEEEIRASYSP